MRSHVLGPGKGPLTQIAFIRFQSSVRKQVALEVFVRRIGVSTDLTDIRFFTGVVSLMYNQFVFPVVRFVTELTTGNRPK